jgi:alanine dehydrogenase
MCEYAYATGFDESDAWFMLPLSSLKNGETGEPLAVINTAVLNPFKTGTVGIIEAGILAQADSRVAGIIISGAQAYRQLRALDHR